MPQQALCLSPTAHEVEPGGSSSFLRRWLPARRRNRQHGLGRLNSKGDRQTLDRLDANRSPAALDRGSTASHHLRPPPPHGRPLAYDLLAPPQRPATGRTHRLECRPGRFLPDPRLTISNTPNKDVSTTSSDRPRGRELVALKNRIVSGFDYLPAMPARPSIGEHP